MTRWRVPGFCFCHVCPRLVAQEASNPEMPTGMGNKSLLSQAEGPGKGQPSQRKTCRCSLPYSSRTPQKRLRPHPRPCRAVMGHTKPVPWWRRGKPGGDLDFDGRPSVRRLRLCRGVSGGCVGGNSEVSVPLSAREMSGAAQGGWSSCPAQQ